MTSRNELTVPKWPFFLADGTFVAGAAVALWFGDQPPGPGTVVTVVLLLLTGALVSLVPYLVETYWNWQHLTAEREEQIALQGQALAKTGAEIAAVVGRWEKIGQGSSGPEAGGAELARQVEEVARGFQQWEARLEAREAKLAEELESLLTRDQEKRAEDREHFDSLLARVRPPTRNEKSSESGAANGRTGRPAGSAVAAAPMIEDQPADALPPAVEEPVPETSDVPVEDPVTIPGEGTDQIADPMVEKPVAAAKERKAAKPKVREETEASLFSTTTVVATAFIGASNKLFLRGDGPGLNWEEGVPMQFVEIGKWSWTTTDAAGPIRLHVFKNDEEEDKAGVLTVEPGQRLDVRPEFDG